MNGIKESEVTVMYTSPRPMQPRLAHLAISTLLLILLMGVFGTRHGYAADENAWYGQFVDGIGQAVFFMAWPTATYRRATVDDIQPLGDGARVTVTLHGISAWDDSSLWVQVILEVRSGKITRLDWGDYNGLVRPGASIEMMGQAIDSLNQQMAAGPRQNAVPAAPASATLVAAICLSNPTAQDITYSLTRSSGTQTLVLEKGQAVIIWSPVDRPEFPITFADSLAAQHGSKTLTVKGVIKAQRPTTCDDAMTVDFQLSGELLGIAPRLWTPEFDHPFIEHVVAGDKADTWKCAPGYRWYAPQDRNSLICVDENVGIIGMTFAADGGGAFPKIVDVLQDSAAGDAGIGVGEYLIQVGGVSVKNMSTEAVLGLIRGDIGSTVRVSVGESDGEVGKTVALTRR
jgi:hypothetical protein